LAELDGVFQWEARAVLRAQGPATLAALAAHWEEFSTNNGAWLLEWAANDDPALAADLIRKAVSAGPGQLAAAALIAASKLPKTPGDLSGFAVPFLSDGNELVRRAAVLCCCDLDFGAFFETESSILVKQACVAKLAKTRGMTAIPELLRHLRSADWRIRAAAADALLFLGPAAVRAAIELVPVAGEPVRTAVARMVASCAEEDLLEAYLRACGAR
jgi:HEAT repeat protein